MTPRDPDRTLARRELVLVAVILALVTRLVELTGEAVQVVLCLQ